jgi:hypothetical protein
MSVFDSRHDEIEKHEFMMGAARGRLAVSLDMLTDALVLIGQHGVYCTSSRNPSKPALDLQTVLSEIRGAKELIQSVMEELRKQREANLPAS